MVKNVDQLSDVQKWALDSWEVYLWATHGSETTHLNGIVEELAGIADFATRKNFDLDRALGSDRYFKSPTESLSTFTIIIISWMERNVCLD